MGKYLNTTIYRATNVDANGSQIVKVYCYWTMKCWNVFSFSLDLSCQRILWSLTGFTHLVYVKIIIHRSSTWPRKLCPATVAVPETILVTLSPYGLCRHCELHYFWFLLICMRIGRGPSRGRGRYSPISIFAIVARFNITNWPLSVLHHGWCCSDVGTAVPKKMSYQVYIYTTKFLIQVDTWVWDKLRCRGHVPR